MSELADKITRKNSKIIKFLKLKNYQKIKISSC